MANTKEAHPASDLIDELDQAQDNTALQPGVETSSYKLIIRLIIIAVLMPLPPILTALAINKKWIPVEYGPVVQDYLTNILVAVAGAFGLGGMLMVSQAASKYIQARGEVSKIKALAATGVTSAQTGPAQSISISQGDKTDDKS